MLKSGWLVVVRVVRGLRNAIAKFAGKNGTNRHWRKVISKTITKEELEIIRAKYGQKGVDACIGIYNISISPCPSCHRSGCILAAAHKNRNITYFRCDLCGIEWKKTWDI